MSLFLAVAILSVLTVSSFKAPCSISKSARQSTRLFEQKFDASKFIRVSLMKPLGVQLEEVKEGGSLGVTIEKVNEGSAKASGKIKSGLYLISANGQDLKFQNFDTILDALGDAPEGKPIDLVFIDPKDVYNGPVTITVKTSDGNSVQINSKKGENLRKTLLDNKIELYSSKAKFTNCGGGASCGTCAVLLTDAPDWDPRADFESAKLKKYGKTGRLSCNVFLEGDCTVIVQPQKDA
jgi:ferredoxin